MSASNRNKSRKGLSRKQKKQILKECAPARENPAVPEKHPAKHSERETSCNGDDRTAEPLSPQAPEPELFKDTASSAAEQNFPLPFPLLNLGLALLLFSLVIAALYTSSINGPFLFDSIGNIEQNPHLQIKDLSLPSLLKAGFESREHNRPVANISFALNYYINGYEVFGYHLVNVIIHIITTFFLYLVARQTLRLSIPDLNPRLFFLISFCGALLWAVHPIQTQSVSYVIQRMNSMAAMFYIISLWAYIMARQSGLKTKIICFTGSAVAALLAIGSKEISATLPISILLYEWFFFQQLSVTWLRRKSPYIVIGCCLVAVIVFVYLGGSPIEKLLRPYSNRNFTMPERVMTEFRVIFFYLSQLLFPHPSRLSLEHDFSISTSMVAPVSTLFSLLGLVCLFLFAIVRARHNRLISFCILWFLLHLVIESSVVNLEIIFEHRVYLPSMFLFITLLAACRSLFKKEWLMLIPCITLAALFSIWTVERNKVWADPEAFWKDCIASAPNSPRPYTKLAGIYLERNQLGLAFQYFTRAIELDNNHSLAYNGLGIIYNRQQKHDQALYYYKEALRTSRGDTFKILTNMGNAYYAKGEMLTAETYYRKALQRYDDFLAHLGLGFIYGQQNRCQEAIYHFQVALAKAAGNMRARYESLTGLGHCTNQLGNTQAAISYYQQALQIQPNSPDIARKLQRLMQKKLLQNTPTKNLQKK